MAEEYLINIFLKIKFGLSLAVALNKAPFQSCFLPLNSESGMVTEVVNTDVSLFSCGMADIYFKLL